MDFSYPAEAEAFRHELRAWLEEHIPDDLRGFGLHHEVTPPVLEHLRAWSRCLDDAGFSALAWPEEHGGSGAGVMEQLVFSEEAARANAPGRWNAIGISNIAPAIMSYGTDVQKQRHLTAIRRGDELWCQGFSEPEAGSDLASVRTTATDEGDHWLVNGQKVWTTLGHHADLCELLVRTDPTVRKHKGLSILLVDMHAPGVDARPLRTMSGGSEFAEVFFTDVRVPKTAILGQPGDGWRVATATLSHERAGVANLALRMLRKVERLVEAAQATDSTQEPTVRQALASCHVESVLLRLLAQRAISASLHGRAPGPESSLTKLLWSDLDQRISRTATLLGPGALSGRWADEIVSSPATSIAGGTTEIQKDIVALRVLGLPR